MNKLKVDTIQIIPIKPKNGLVGFASATINNQLYLGNIAIYSSPTSPLGFRVVYPTKRLPNNSQIPLFHPINKETGFALQEKIVDEYLKLMENLTKGEFRNEPKQDVT